MAETATRLSRGLLWAIALLIACVAVAFAFRATRTKVVVRAARAEHGDLVSTVSTNGKVEPTQDFQAHAPATGEIQKLYIKLGEHVAKGQQLLRMDASDAASKVAAAQATLQASNAALQNMQSGGTQDERLAAHSDLQNAQTAESSAASALTSLQALATKGAASPNEVAQARQHLAVDQARVSQLQARRTGRYDNQDLSTQRAQVAESRASLQAAQAAYADVDLRAPFAGTVYSLPIAPFNFVQAGEPLLSIADLDHLQVRAYFDEPVIGRLAVGQAVRIVWDAKPNLVWHGRVSQAPTTVITYGTRNVGEALISVDDAHGDLLPNTNVTVTVTALQHFDVLTLPREALHTEGNRSYVFRIVHGRLIRTPVSVGVVTLTRVEVTSGLQQGDLVALNATSEVDLEDGMDVKAQK